MFHVLAYAKCPLFGILISSFTLSIGFIALSQHLAVGW